MQPTAREEIGFYGGFFGPPTIGHLRTADAIRKAAGLSLLYMITAAQPNHRKALLGAEERHGMLIKAVAQYPGLQASRIEIDRGGTTYTLDTIRELKVLHPGARINLVFGPEYLDPKATWFIANWHQSAQLLQECRIITHPRGGVATLEQTKAWAQQVETAEILVVDCPILEISSTLVRERAAHGDDLAGLVPDEIIDDVRRYFGNQSA